MYKIKPNEDAIAVLLKQRKRYINLSSASRRIYLYNPTCCFGGFKVCFAVSQEICSPGRKAPDPLWT